MRLVDNWWRTLTHGYAQWCVYFSIGLQFLLDNLPSVSEVLPAWVCYGVLGVGLVLRVVKQDSVSGAAEPDVSGAGG